MSKIDLCLKLIGSVMSTTLLNFWKKYDEYVAEVLDKKELSIRG